MNKPGCLSLILCLMILVISTVGLGRLAWASTNEAEEQGTKPDEVMTCDSTTLSQNECLKQAIRRSDANIKRLKRQVQNQAAPLTNLNESIERSHYVWMQFVDSDCNSESLDAFGGSSMDTRYLKCRQQHNESRLRFLSALLQEMKRNSVCRPSASSSERQRPKTASETKLLVSEFEKLLQSIESRIDQEGIFKEPVESRLRQAFLQSQTLSDEHIETDCRLRYFLMCHRQAGFDADLYFNWTEQCREDQGRQRLVKIRQRLVGLRQLSRDFLVPPEKRTDQRLDVRARMAKPTAAKPRAESRR